MFDIWKSLVECDAFIGKMSAVEELHVVVCKGILEF